MINSERQCWGPRFPAIVEKFPLSHIMSYRKYDNTIYGKSGSIFLSPIAASEAYELQVGTTHA
jgi:hypothetical protein